jgi:Fe-S cluster assembly protein SufD
MSDQTTIAPEGVTDAINSEAVAAVTAGDPDWLTQRRQDAWTIYESSPMPTTKLEEWRYTDLKKLLELDSLSFSSVQAVEASAYPAGLQTAMDADREASGHVVMIDGTVVQTDLEESLAARGVVLSSLRAAVNEHAELLERHLATEAVPASDGKFQALNAALWTDGVFLHVPRGVHVDVPIRVSRWVTRGGQAVFTRTLIVAHTGSRVSFVDEILSDDLESQSLVSSSVEVIAQDAAQVQYAGIQRLGHGAFYQSAQRTLAQRDSKLDTLNVTLGGSVTRVDLNARLLGPGSHSDMLGLYFGDTDQHFDHNTSQDHVADNANSDLLYKGALDHRSRSVFRGIIRVHPGAQRTDAYQTNRNLLLSEDARADSLPNLEIEADDVKCSHGATVGQLDRETLFYLMSRGMSRPQAERLVVMGFLGEVMARLPLGGVVEKVSRAIQEKLDNH